MMLIQNSPVSIRLAAFGSCETRSATLTTTV